MVRATEALLLAAAGGVAMVGSAVTGDAVAGDVVVGDAVAAEYRGVDPEVIVEREGDVVFIDAGLYIPHPPPDVLDALLDYGDHARFLGAVDSSRVLAVRGDTLHVWQNVSYQFIVRRAYSFELEVVRRGADRVDFRQVSGDLHGYHGTWDAIPVGTGTRLRYRAQLDHGLGLPWFLGWRVLSGAVGDLLPELAREVDRRAAVSDTTR